LQPIAKGRLWEDDEAQQEEKGSDEDWREQSIPHCRHFERWT
jgi:hypothetical protein